MTDINQYELDCLKRISAQPCSSVAPCAGTVLQHLLISGLIEQCPTTSLPLEMSRLTYRITPLGSNLIKESVPGQ